MHGSWTEPAVPADTAVLWSQELRREVNEQAGLLKCRVLTGDEFRLIRQI